MVETYEPTLISPNFETILDSNEAGDVVNDTAALKTLQLIQEQRQLRKANGAITIALPPPIPDIYVVRLIR